uniref:Protein kinase domain-containing protein n=1 Tax=Mycena chlorophos TaxID=658473 RepID=A0ABQ0L6W2_MYCCL|nr:predicted protein [Mycena chlorophos]
MAPSVDITPKENWVLFRADSDLDKLEAELRVLDCDLPRVGPRQLQPGRERSKRNSATYIAELVRSILPNHHEQDAASDPVSTKPQKAQLYKIRIYGNTRELSILKPLAGESHRTCKHVWQLLEEDVKANGFVDLKVRELEGQFLKDLIKHHHGFSEVLTQRLILQLVRGIAYIHENNIAHCNINLETVVVELRVEAGKPELHLQITDFAHAAWQGVELCAHDIAACGLIAWKCVEGNRGSVFSGDRDIHDDFKNLRKPALHDQLRLPDLVQLKLYQTKEGIQTGLTHTGTTKGVVFINTYTLPIPGVEMREALKDPWLGGLDSDNAED